MSLHSPKSVLWTLATVNDAVTTTQDLRKSQPQTQTHNHRTLRKNCLTTYQIGDLPLSNFPKPQHSGQTWEKAAGINISIQDPKGISSFSLQIWYKFLIPKGFFPVD